MDRGELDEWLALLERDELIERRGPARAFAGELEYAFRHDLLKDASYQMLTPEDRRAGHRLAGAWLVAHGEADAVVLAEHFAGGGATAQAVNWFERAAEGALAGGAGAEDVAALRKAAAYYRRAGETCAAAYANDAAIGHLERAAALFASIDPVEAARTRLALAKVREVSGEPDAALEDLRAAEEEAAKSVELRVEILLSRSYVLGRSGREGALDRGIETAEAALALAKGVSRDLELRATTTLAGLLARMETAASIQRSVELAQRALAMSEDRRDLGLAVWRLANAFLTGNQLDSAARLYDDALVSAEAERDEYLVAMCHANMAMLAFRRWRLDEAIAHAHEALERHERIGYQTRILETTLNLGMFLHLRGESERGRELLGNVLAQSRSDWFLSTLAQETLADVERFAGREARAQARLRSAARTCERVGIAAKQALYLGMLAESFWASGHGLGASAMLDSSAAADPVLSLGHALVRLHVGPLDVAIEVLVRSVATEVDPQRRAMAHLALGRGHLWTGDRAAARTACDAALAILAPSPVPRFTLPPRCLLAVLDADLGSALRLLGQIQSACAPYEHGEAVLDVGLALVDTDADRALVDSYLELSHDVRHRGLRPHIERIRARLFARVGDDASARSASERASAELRVVLDGVTDSARAAFAAHPLVTRLHVALPARAPSATPPVPAAAPAAESPPPARYGASPPSSARTATLARWLVEQLLAQPNDRSPEFVVEAGPAAGERLRLPPWPARITIGSATGADWQLADRALAGAHLVIERSVDGVRATRASRSPARTREGVLPTSAPGALLTDGNVIDLGSTRLRYLDPATAFERALDEQLATAAAPMPEPPTPRITIGVVIAVLIAVTAIALAVWVSL